MTLAQWLRVGLAICLLPLNAVGAERPDEARAVVRVSSISDLREAMEKSNQRIVMEQGVYVVSDLHDATTAFSLSGSDNHFDLSGVTIQMPISTLRKMSSKKAHGRACYKITGDRVTLEGGTFENTYPGDMTAVTDFGGYNQNRQYYPPRGLTEVSVKGSDVSIIACKFIIRGSYPYGYGNMYGIGAGSVVGLKKHCGIQITGDRALVDGCNLKMEAFGHVIFTQGGNRTTVRNTMIEGTLRPSNDCYNETDDGDLARKFSYQLQWPEEVKGLPIPRDHMINCTEDGIRAYNGAGEMIVENCVVKKTRGGIKLYMARSARVTNCKVLDCVIQGYSLPSGGVIKASSGNAAYGPLLYIHFDSHSSQTIDLEVLPAPHGLGDHPLAAVKGQGHSITFKQTASAASETLRPIIVGYPMRFDFLCVDYPDVPEGHEKHFAKYSPKTYEAAGITVNNGTPHPIVLGKLSEKNTVDSVGAVTDLGADNRVSRVEQNKFPGANGVVSNAQNAD